MCTHESRKKHGRDRKGTQRWKCRTCGATFYTTEQRPLGDMRTDLDKAAAVLNMLLEGTSIRAASRISGVKADTICDLIVLIGERCDRFLRERIRGVQAATIELDEIWDFIYCKRETAERKGFGSEFGDSWTWLAIDADSKMILSYAVGKRDEATGLEFLERLNAATTGRCQVTSDGLSVYTYNVPLTFGSRVDFAQLVKTYASSQEETRYSPAKITSAEGGPIWQPRRRQDFDELRRAAEPVRQNALPSVHTTDQRPQQERSPSRSDGRPVRRLVLLLPVQHGLEDEDGPGSQDASHALRARGSPLDHPRASGRCGEHDQDHSSVAGGPGHEDREDCRRSAATGRGANLRRHAAIRATRRVVPRTTGSAWSRDAGPVPRRLARLGGG